jgi:hypothetical protein
MYCLERVGIHISLKPEVATPSFTTTTTTPDVSVIIALPPLPPPLPSPSSMLCPPPSPLALSPPPQLRRLISMVHPKISPSTLGPAVRQETALPAGRLFQRVGSHSTGPPGAGTPRQKTRPRATRHEISGGIQVRCALLCVVCVVVSMYCSYV